MCILRFFLTCMPDCEIAGVCVILGVSACGPQCCTSDVRACCVRCPKSLVSCCNIIYGCLASLNDVISFDPRGAPSYKRHPRGEEAIPSRMGMSIYASVIISTINNDDQ